MPSHLPPSRIPDAEILSWFLDDISQTPILSSRQDWLPLLRQIRRGMLLKQFLTNVGEQKVQELDLHKFKHYLHEQLATYNGYCRANGQSALDTSMFARGLDALFESADFIPSFPIRLDFGNNTYEMLPDLMQAQVERGWEIAFLLTLLPVELRAEWSTVSESIDLTNYVTYILSNMDVAKNKLTTGTLRYVLRQARHYVGKGLPYLDLVQEGVIGLMRAAESFHEERGRHFQHYASNWIRQAVTRAIPDQSRLIRIPVHRHESTAKIAAVYRDYVDTHGHAPDLITLGLQLGELSHKDLLILDKQRQVVALKQKLRTALDLYTYSRRSSRKEKLKRAKVRGSTHNIGADQQAQNNSPEADLASSVVSDDALLDQGTTISLSGGPKARRRLQALWVELSEVLGRTPKFIEYCLAASWIDQAEVSLLQESKSESFVNALRTARANIRKVAITFDQVRLAEDYHFSTEEDLSLFDSSDEENNEGHAGGTLVADDMVSHPVEQNDQHDVLMPLLGLLNERAASIIELRFGLLGEEALTLEEVGQRYRLTRERVRQLEAKAVRRLQHPQILRKLKGSLSVGEWLVDLVQTQEHRALLWKLEWRTEFDVLLDETRARQERLALLHLLDQRLPQARPRRVLNTLSQKGRAELFRRILNVEGLPLHFGELHARALAEVPEQLSFSKKTTYATLFYHSYFQGYGSGMFGLIEWQQHPATSRAERIYLHCPEPFLNGAKDPRSFLETIMIGRMWLKEDQTMPAQKFYLNMLGWASRPQENFAEAQDAFDAWHAVGMLAPVDYAMERHLPMKMTLPEALSLTDIRVYCLTTACERIPKMLEILAIVDQFPRPTATIIQRALFGSEGTAQDVQTRLRFLAAFDAVRKEGDIWRLGAPGKTLLSSHSALDLPDWSEFTEESESDDVPLELEWDESSGLILI